MDAKPCEQDWFFGQLQIAGFNTTNLRGVLAQAEPGADDAIGLDTLLAKMPVSDALLQAVSGDATLSLRQAAEQRRLYAVDYALLDGARSDPLHGQQRYMAAPIALFYWNPKAPGRLPACQRRRAATDRHPAGAAARSRDRTDLHTRRPRPCQ